MKLWMPLALLWVTACDRTKAGNEDLPTGQGLERLETSGRLTGVTAGEQSGSAIAGAGDVDGDGLTDLIIGAPYRDTRGYWAGAAYLVSGPMDGSSALHLSDAQFYGWSDFDHLGAAVSSAGDVDGDGYADLLIGAPGRDADTNRDVGMAYLVTGPLQGYNRVIHASSKFQGAAEGDAAGSSLTTIGDVNGDGLSDFAIGAPLHDAGAFDQGAVYIFLGPSTGLSSVDEADSTWTGESAFDEAGHALAAAGDVDGDGLDDLLVGAPNQDGDAINGGAAYLLTDVASTSGSLAAARGVLRGPNMGDRAGYALAGYGDVDGDGHADLAVSALGDDEGGTEAGAVYLVRGPVEGQVSLLDVYGKLTGEGRMDQAGTSLAGVGDINADGYPDLVVGAPLQDDRGTTTGAAYVIAVPQPGSHSLQNHTQFFGEDYGDHGGAAVAGIGDSDGDGRPDFVVAAPIADGHHPEVGHSYLYLGLSED